MEKRKVVYILSRVEKAVAFEWIVEEFKATEIELQFIILHDNFDTTLASFLKEKGVKLFQFKLGNKAYFPILWLKVIFLLLKIRPHVVHTHLFEASLLGLLASKLVGIKKRVYTRHHSTYHHAYFPKAVKYDRWINFLATDIVAISNNVREVLINKEQVPSEKIQLIEHGFRLEQFQSIGEDRKKRMLQKHQLPEDKTIIAVVSRYIKWKGVYYAIKAYQEIHKKYPDTHLLLANAGGPYEKVIKEELSKLDPHSFTEIRFEEDLFALYSIMNIYVHVPIDLHVEAFGQTYVEALAAGVPSVFTLSGIARDFVVHKKNAFVVTPKDEGAIFKGIEYLLNHQDQSASLILEGKSSVKRFALNEMTERLKKLYRKN